MLRQPVESAQYTSLAFGRRLTDTGLVASMGTIGDALDNAVAESFFATLECELLNRHDWPTRQALRTAVFDFIEVFYNRQPGLTVRLRAVSGRPPERAVAVTGRLIRSGRRGGCSG